MAAPPLNSGTTRPSSTAESQRDLVGISFPFRKENGEFPARVRNADCVQNNIFTLFKTPKRSRIMRPLMGTNAYDLVFESQGSLLKTRLDRGIRQTIKNGEPRANPLSIRITDTDSETTAEVLYEVQGVREVIALDPFQKK